jgi:hypothetical protein
VGLVTHEDTPPSSYFHTFWLYLAQDETGALFSVDPVTDERRILSDFGDATQCVDPGPEKCLGHTPFGVAMDALGKILVIDLGAGTDQRDALFSIDPSGERAGERTILSDFGDAT